VAQILSPITLLHEPPEYAQAGHSERIVDELNLSKKIISFHRIAAD
jgi:hypothetical protein